MPWAASAHSYKGWPPTLAAPTRTSNEARTVLALVVLLAPTKPITKHILLLVDVSGSMNSSKRASKALEAASMIARQPVDEAAVTAIAWGQGVSTYPGGWERLPSEEGAQRIETWLGSQRTTGDTFLAPALKAALSRTESELTVIVVTDGELHNDTEAGLLHVLKQAQAARKQGPATVGVWGIGHDKPRNTLLALARAGGGGYVASPE